MTDDEAKNGLLLERMQRLKFCKKVNESERTVYYKSKTVWDEELNHLALSNYNRTMSYYRFSH